MTLASSAASLLSTGTQLKSRPSSCSAGRTFMKWSALGAAIRRSISGSAASWLLLLLCVLASCSGLQSAVGLSEHERQ